jgi:hypothetical protein
MIKFILADGISSTRQPASVIQRGYKWQRRLLLHIVLATLTHSV